MIFEMAGACQLKIRFPGFRIKKNAGLQPAHFALIVIPLGAKLLPPFASYSSDDPDS